LEFLPEIKINLLAASTVLLLLLWGQIRRVFRSKTIQQE